LKHGKGRKLWERLYKRGRRGEESIWGGWGHIRGKGKLKKRGPPKWQGKIIVTDSVDTASEPGGGVNEAGGSCRGHTRKQTPEGGLNNWTEKTETSRIRGRGGMIKGWENQ